MSQITMVDDSDASTVLLNDSDDSSIPASECTLTELDNNDVLDLNSLYKCDDNKEKKNDTFSKKYSFENNVCETSQESEILSLQIAKIQPVNESKVEQETAISPTNSISMLSAHDKSPENVLTNSFTTKMTIVDDCSENISSCKTTQEETNTQSLILLPPNQEIETVGDKDKKVGESSSVVKDEAKESNNNFGENSTGFKEKTNNLDNSNTSDDHTEEGSRKQKKDLNLGSVLITEEKKETNEVAKEQRSIASRLRNENSDSTLHLEKSLSQLKKIEDKLVKMEKKISTPKKCLNKKDKFLNKLPKLKEELYSIVIKNKDEKETIMQLKRENKMDRSRLLKLATCQRMLVATLKHHKELTTKVANAIKSIEETEDDQVNMSQSLLINTQAPILPPSILKRSASQANIVENASKVAKKTVKFASPFKYNDKNLTTKQDNDKQENEHKAKSNKSTSANHSNEKESSKSVEALAIPKENHPTFSSIETIKPVIQTNSSYETNQSNLDKVVNEVLDEEVVSSINISNISGEKITKELEPVKLSNLNAKFLPFNKAVVNQPLHNTILQRSSSQPQVHTFNVGQSGYPTVNTGAFKNNFNTLQSNVIHGNLNRSCDSFMKTFQRPSSPSPVSECKSLAEMIQEKIIFPKDNILALVHNNSIYTASLTEDGLIRNDVGEVFLSPMIWLQSVARLKSRPLRTRAYKCIFYNGTSLHCLCNRSIQNNQKLEEVPVSDCVSFTMPNTANSSKSSTDMNDMEQEPSILRNLNKFLKESYIQMHLEDEFFPTSFLPKDFWKDPTAEDEGFDFLFNCDEVWA